MSRRGHLVRQACGCTHDGHCWLELCAAHTLEAGELHARAQAEHQARQLAELERQGATIAQEVEQP